MGHTSEFPFGIYWWTLKNLKNQIFEKWNNLLGIPFYTCVAKANHMRYSSWGMFWDRILLSFWVFLCPFNPLPPNKPENQNFETKKTFRDVIILNFCNKKHYHIYIIFCHFRPFFVLVPHWKLKFWKNVKKQQEISFSTCVLLTRIICTPDMVPVWFLRYEVQQTESLQIVLKISKMKKTPRDIII